MKKSLNNIVIAFTVICAVLSQSCDKDFEEINTNPNNSIEAYPHQFLASALVSTLTTNMMRNYNFNNELMQVTVNVSDADGRVFRYDYRSNWSDYMWNNHYTQLTNFREMYIKATNDVTYNTSYQGISLICQSWIYSILTDTYGDIPYSEALQARDGLILEPKFDAQRDIYMDIFDKLDTANVLLAQNQAIDATADPVYAGSVANWRRFGNSLYLRLLLRIAHRPETQDFVIGKINEILESNTATYPIISNNAQSAILRWTGVAPYISPYMSLRVQDFRGIAIAAFFIDNLRDWNDPRINIPEYGVGGVNRWAIAPAQGIFEGVTSGYAPGEEASRLSYFYSSDQQAASQMQEPLTGQMMNFAEIQFIKAEAVLNGWISGSAETFYNSGTQNSITLWLPDWSKPITEYLEEADIQWDESESYADKLHKIHLQKYYALFRNGLEQWFEHRRTGYPVLPKGAGLFNNGEMPSRMVYPIYVQSSNRASYRAAVEAQGADEINTKVWWQKP